MKKLILLTALFIAIIGQSNGQNWSTNITVNNLIFGKLGSPYLDNTDPFTIYSLSGGNQDLLLFGNSNPNILNLRLLDGALKIGYNTIPDAQILNDGSGYFSRIGIGVNSAQSKLHLQQSSGGWADGIRLSYMSKNWDIVSDHNGDRLLIARDQDLSKGLTLLNGNLGVGLSSPEQKLHVGGSMKAEGLVITGSANFGQVQMLSNDGQTYFYIQKPTSPGMPFSISLGYQNIDGGIMIGREDWTSKVIIPWNVGIGTNDPDSKLTVKGDIHAQEVKVDLLGAVAPDYVFEETYYLQSLAEVEAYIKQNKHLPEIPSAKEMKENGVNLKEMNMLLLKKVEELTLYVIELKKESNEAKKENERQNQLILELLNRK